MVKGHNGSSGFISYNYDTTHSSLLHKKLSPFIVLYGYHPSSITPNLIGKVKVKAIDHDIEHQEEILQVLKGNLVMKWNGMKELVNQNCSEIEFEVRVGYF